MPLNNFGIVKRIATPSKVVMLCRGANPDASGFKALNELGVDICYKLDTNPEFSYTQESNDFKGIVVRDEYPELFRYDLNHVLKTCFCIQGHLHNGHSVFVHCLHGKDRTSLIINAWSLIYDGKSFDEIIQQRREYGVGWLRDKADFLDIMILKQINKINT